MKGCRLSRVGEFDRADGCGKCNDAAEISGGLLASQSEAPEMLEAAHALGSSEKL